MFILADEGYILKGLPILLICSVYDNHCQSFCVMTSSVRLFSAITSLLRLSIFYGSYI